MYLFSVVFLPSSYIPNSGIAGGFPGSSAGKELLDHIVVFGEGNGTPL